MPEHYSGVPVIGMIAASGTGKTTLLQKIIPLLRQAGLRVGCIKHTHHPFEIDRPGKDSYRLREAGASQMLLGSAGRWALMVETGDNSDAPLAELIARLDLTLLDVVLVEGFRLEEIPKIEVHRQELSGTFHAPGADHVIAVATNQSPRPTGTVTVLDIDSPANVAAFIVDRVAHIQGLQARPPAG